MIVFIYKDNSEQFQLYNLPDTLAVLISLIGTIGTLLGFIIILSGTESILYARTVNGVRKYFCDNAKDFSKAEYIILPTDTKTFSYLGCGDLAFITLITGLINSFYLSLGFPQISLLKVICMTRFSQEVLSILIFIVFVLLHFCYYLYALKKKREEVWRE